MRKTYIPAPGFSIPPPPLGPVNLGHILNDLADFSPLNDDGYIDISKPFPPDEKTGFKTTRKKLLSGHFGVFAQVLAIFGVGADAHGLYERGSEDILSVDRLETIAFNPSDSYIRESLQADGVKIFLEACKYRKPVFMITGLKIARGASLESSRTRTVGAKLKIGFSHPGLPGEIGPDLGLERSGQTGVSFQGSTDFVLAIRVKKISYRKGGVVSSPYLKGATMMDESGEQAYSLVLEDSEQDVELADMPADDLVFVDGTSFDDNDPSVWILPKAGVSDLATT